MSDERSSHVNVLVETADGRTIVYEVRRAAPSEAADDFGAVRPAAGEADTKESVA